MTAARAMGSSARDEPPPEPSNTAPAVAAPPTTSATTSASNVRRERRISGWLVPRSLPWSMSGWAPGPSACIVRDSTPDDLRRGSSLSCRRHLPTDEDPEPRRATTKCGSGDAGRNPHGSGRGGPGRARRGAGGARPAAAPSRGCARAADGRRRGPGRAGTRRRARRAGPPRYLGEGDRGLACRVARRVSCGPAARRPSSLPTSRAGARRARDELATELVAGARRSGRDRARGGGVGARRARARPRRRMPSTRSPRSRPRTTTRWRARPRSPRWARSATSVDALRCSPRVTTSPPSGVAPCSRSRRSPGLTSTPRSSGR